jgi:hypothetical protein
VRHAARQGLTVVARLDIVPEWARPAGSSDRYLDETHYDDFANYVAAFLKRYRPYGMRHVIIWNEPNLAFEWGRRPPDPAAYAALLRAVYPRAKAAAPDAVVIAAGLSPQIDSGDGSERMSDLEFLSKLYDAGAGPYFDMLAAHTYGAQSPPDAPPDPATITFRRVELLHAALAARGEPHKQLIVTEGGWNDSLRWVQAVAPSQRLRWTVEAYTLAQRWDWMAAVCLWQFATPWSTHTYQDHWSFVAPDGTPKAIYWAVRAAATGREE